MRATPKKKGRNRAEGECVARIKMCRFEFLTFVGGVCVRVFCCGDNLWGECGVSCVNFKAIIEALATLTLMGEGISWL